MPAPSSPPVTLTPRREADHRADAAPFAEFMLAAIRDAWEALPLGDQESDQVKSLVGHLSAREEDAAAGLMSRLGLKHRPAFRKNHLNPALGGGWIEMTDPDSPRSPVQRYRLTPKGRRIQP